MKGVDRQQFARLAGISAIIVVLWVMFGIFTSSEFSRRLDSTSTDVWTEVLLYQLTASLMWAAFTPVAIFIAERLPFRKPHRLRNLVLLLAIAPLFSLVRSAVGGAVFELCELGRVSAAFVWLSVTIRFHRNIFLFLVVVGIVNLVLLQRASAARERNALALRTAVMNAELQRLRTSMQPRLMFATLDAIAAKVRDEPVVADRMLVELGHLLRALLEFGKRPSVTLAEELELIDRYFDIERMRTGGTFSARVDLEEELLEVRVPPLALYTLLASALLDAGETPRRVEIRGRTAGGMLLLDVRYDAVQQMPAPDTVHDTRAGLGSDATIQWRHAGGAVVAELALPLAGAEATA